MDWLRGLVTWIEFKEELISRFGEILVEDVVEEFNKLSQVGSVDEFLGKFEDLKAQMLIRNPALNEAHFLSSFIGALKEEIRFAVKLFKPITLKIAIEKARMQELAIKAAQRRNKTIVNKRPANPAVKNTTFRLSLEVYEHRKINHLCFKCREKYGPGHVCKRRQLNCLIGEAEAEIDMSEIITPQEADEPPDVMIEGVVEQEIQQAVCLNALTGHNQGSTHSFIDEHTVQATGHESSHCPPVRVTVADGNYGRTFMEDLLIIPLGGCDLVLGNDWMKKHNPTKFDHERRCVIIGRKPNKLVLPALVEGSLKMLTSGSMS
ncbi:hypothetical protein KY290_027311 [Solanum tuberosum]|uniref:Retrotransposon gag domain-containing protein n=1 Tax=Solanum tuberosum TaxID=4113 RepID=A0ABQ7UET1_SOLTU|nr:hypothetical protein KY290_027311 [Solanum tuberosum]